MSVLILLARFSRLKPRDLKAANKGFDLPSHISDLIRGTADNEVVPVMLFLAKAASAIDYVVWKGFLAR